MTTPEPQQPPPPVQPRRTWLWVLAGVAGFVFMFVIGITVGQVVTEVSPTDSEAYAAERAQAIAESEAWYSRWAASASASPPPAPLPSPSDFTIDVKVLRKACFGSYGCNVTYEIDPTYTGATPLTGRTFTVIYEVTGSEYGPLINNFDVNSDGTASLKGQELTRTSSSAATLKAKATSVSED